MMPDAQKHKRSIPAPPASPWTRRRRRCNHPGVRSTHGPEFAAL